MQAMQTVTYDDAEQREPVRAWIESRAGTIVRGVVGVLSEDGALIQLSSADALQAGENVTVRLSFERSAPTLATAARVLSMRVQDEAFECDVEWTSGPERARLASFVAARG